MTTPRPRAHTVGCVNETAQNPHGVRTEARLIRGGLATVRADLFSGAFAFRPLPPLPADHRVIRRIPKRMQPYGKWLPHALIVLVAAFLMLLGTAADNYSYLYGSRPSTELFVIGLFAAVPVLLTLSRPVAAFWLSLALTLVGSVGFLSSWEDAFPWSVAGFLAHLVVMTQVALRSRPRVALEMWLITLFFGVAALMITGATPAAVAAMTVLSGFSLAAAASLHGWTSARQEVAVKTAEVVAQEEDTLAERSKRTRLEERTNIARELHDVVAHHMSVVAIQAEAAPYRVENPPPELEQAFATIRENAVAALTELRRVLGVVRAEDYAAPDAPQPTLAELDGLLANVREAGLTVEKTVTGALRELPPGVELSAYRIVQEALSNTLRHAPGASAKVEVAYVLGGLGLRIVNGPPTGLIKTSPGAGHGITGMRERVTMLGGAMTAGESADGGYEVSVFLPVEQAPHEETGTGEGA